MITVYKHIEEELVADYTVSDATKGSWVNLVNPDPDELSLINILTEIPTDVLKTALDMEERSHVELEDNYIFIVINIPVIRGNDMYDTVPLGIFSAIYMVEYAKKGNKIVSIVRVTAETLSGIPSIVYGLFGMIFFVGVCHFGNSLLAGALTVAIMVLPTVMRTTEEALLSVPNSFREGSFGLGAGKLRTVFKVVLPSAVPGILSGIILATGRIVGETAALIYTAGTVAKVPERVFDSTRTLAVHMYNLSKEGLNTNQAYATAVVLLIVVILINMLSNFAARKLSAKQK